MKAFRKISTLALACLMVVMSVAGLVSCGNSNAWPVDEATGLTELYIGGIGPLTGDYANYGVSVKQGAELAADEINAAGGVNGFKLVVNYEDSQGSADSAVSAYGKHLDDGMKVSLGGVLSGETASVVAAAKDDGILILTPSASSVAAIDGNDAAFRVCFSDPDQGYAAAQYVRDYNLGTKVAVFYASDNDYCVGLYESFASKKADYGFEIVEVQTFDDSSKTDFSTQINAIAASGAEVVFVPIYAAEAAQFLTQAEGKLNIPVFGCDGFDGLLTKISDVSVANGVLMLTPFTADSPEANVKAFVSAYTAKYNTIPDQFAADGYDAIYAIKAALEKAELKSDDVEDFNDRMVAAIKDITIVGTTGEMSWQDDGNFAKDAKLMEFVDGKVVAYVAK